MELGEETAPAEPASLRLRMSYQPAFLGSSPQFSSSSPCIKVKASEKSGKKQAGEDKIGWDEKLLSHEKAGHKEKEGQSF